MFFDFASLRKYFLVQMMKFSHWLANRAILWWKMAFFDKKLHFYQYNLSFWTLKLKMCLRMHENCFLTLEIERTHPNWSKTSRVCRKNTSPSLNCNYLNTLFRVTILDFRVTIWSFEVQYLPSKRATFGDSRSTIGDFKVTCSVLNVTNVHNFFTRG